MEPRASGGALFREIHKNTWLRRLNVEGKRPSVLTKKPDRYWVVFCVHDDCEAFLEGYADPRQAPSHNPEWSLALQTVQHISHALVPVEQEFEFVITLGNDVARFNANTWDCMQEWVESLRSKLREMKLLSPKENLYSKLPEAKPPLAPTRDPTSPLPATPPVPAAIVPGIERVQPSSLLHSALQAGSGGSSSTSLLQSASNSSPFSMATPNLGTSPPQPPPITAMSNTSTQNLMNLLTNPLQAVSSINNQHISSQHLFDAISLASDLSDGSIDDYSTDLIKQFISNSASTSLTLPSSEVVASSSGVIPSGSGSSSSKTTLAPKDSSSAPQLQNGSAVICSTSLATTFANNVLADPGTASLKRTEQKVLVDVKADNFGFSTDSGSDEDVDANNSSGTSSSRSSSSSNSSSSGLLEANGNESSLLSTPTARQSSAKPITPSSPFCKARQQHRIEQKKTRRKCVQQGAVPIPANVTIIEVPNGTNAGSSPVKSILSPSAKRRTPKPDPKGKTTNSTSTLITDDLSDDNYKSNVQIIPSNIEYDHNFHHHLQDQEPSIIASINDRQITTVKVSNLVNTSGTGTVTITSAIVPPAQAAVIATVATSSTPIKADSNFGTVTQIAVNSCDRPQTPPSQQQHYEHVFLLPTPIQVVTNQDQPTSLQSPVVSAVSSASNGINKSKVMLLSKQQRSSSHSDIQLNRVKNLRNGQGNKENQAESSAAGVQSVATSTKTGILSSASSPTVPSANLSPTVRPTVDKNIYTPQPQRTMLQRGLTEMVISRSTNVVVSGGRENDSRGRQPAVNAKLSVNKFRNEVNEQRRRSSSTSDAQPESSGNALPRVRLNGATSRLQSPPQPFRPHHQFINQQDQGPNGSNRKLTLREQQVMQLRREMMHPGGVQLQLRRKDCINSIGLVDAFGAVWVAGWKQKEHPVLYNALHIGDQLISIAGVAITSAAEAHKAIRGAPGLFVKLIIRRVPFGRVYAIRRELNGQCLGLIRDGNTATIVDVVPNSLAARHGLPPKAQSCDGLSLTFWVLTEINGRPLNLFFKDNEIRDRLNAVGKDISILVQPADLVTKLKKQLKSLRGHKDFIVQ
ncbi:serine-rich adhesin for platelets [Sabethes cyaneus]|uniref:serine-rich adhesin for platelets n=1 Tax=Sabethes cyaneus TaxID=53552 RepID=UPI00237E04E3|nr:serine-rich adhesin for platelets [Sabethes cyaneus]XP_053684467.1 serine-rich adhesin for platelets [Sabethes cyaneus]XP_053684476.1 serine-rich adhesin for platelets [Sabethes cyaneus]XP_053684485.1 serine-rich adhesin for platelets [Sabethes cyaneus]XP_053684493.1 serine-rich adhesin for platelets [Sabethes cyaneus]XP_053684503.1 serine-rich adhesin for platelets [Sabethes cyaneus]XP_053684511.1 serine-rich adhesin for platelets [Sabethes cyaneus]